MVSPSSLSAHRAVWPVPAFSLEELQQIEHHGAVQRRQSRVLLRGLKFTAVNA